MKIPTEFQHNLNGHTVDARELDKFHNGSDGSLVTDEQWDISRDREAHSVEDLADLGFSYVGAECPPGHEIAEGETNEVVTTDN